ncbi:MAG: sulfite exporter TauE/SafE family protein [Spirochaetota bacterium]
MSLAASLATSEWVWVAVAALLIGMAKAGLAGAAIFGIPVMATIFGAQESTGIVLPMLIAADIVAVIYYRRHAQWNIVLQLLPWTLLGIGTGVFVGDVVSDDVFRILLAIIVLVGLALMTYRELYHSDIVLPRKLWIAAILGTVAGFSTMVGNAAGPLMSLYLLSMGLEKNQLIGTGAWFFFVVNVIKVPFHVIFWGTITFETLVIDLLAVPVIVGGVFLGLVLVRLIPEKAYRYFIIVSTTIVSIRLLI